ncbi:MAG: toll/interleukin-1 receptor domain-containing protein [bacterium]|nr:toll/interleukin-1 receptor domain-containing protein [bacterium]
MSRAFISYAQQDQDVAARMASGLADRGIQIWFDQQEILAGDSIVERIREGIRSADYLIILLSEQSRKSEWVEREIGIAFERFGEEAATAIIPVLIDDTSVPPRFSTIRYVDLSQGYAQAISEIVARIERDCEGKVDLEKVINTEDLAVDIAAERKIPKGSGFYVTAVLGFLSILATLIAAYPSFEGAFSRVPKVYYDLNSDRISHPPGTDEQKVLKALKDAGIAPAVLRIRIINKGRAPAKEVKIGSKTDGNFLYINSDPSASSKSVWVDIAVQKFHQGDKEAVVHLKNLVPDKKVVVDFGYEPPKTNSNSDVVAAGVLAERVQDIDHVPQWTLWSAFEMPLTILLGGMLLSVLIGIGVAARTNPRLRVKLIALLNAVTVTLQ